MATISEDYVSDETFKLLKEKGFDDSCCRFVVESDETYHRGAPTLQMAMKWLREKHNLFIQITVDFSDGAYPMYDICVVNLATCISFIVNGYNRYSYKEAVETAIKYCLENLI